MCLIGTENICVTGGIARILINGGRGEEGGHSGEEKDRQIK